MNIHFTSFGISRSALVEVGVVILMAKTIGTVSYSVRNEESLPLLFNIA